MSDAADMRAVRLSAMLPVLEAADDFAAGSCAELRPYVDPVAQAIVSMSTTEDYELARACLDAERDFRRRQWAALERLLSAIPLGGALDDIFDIPAKECVAALLAAVACGWFRPGA